MLSVAHPARLPDRTANDATELPAHFHFHQFPQVERWLRDHRDFDCGSRSTRARRWYGSLSPFSAGLGSARRYWSRAQVGRRPA